MSPDDRPVRVTHLWRRDGDRMVVFSSATFNIRRFDFNNTGARVWDLCDGTLTSQEIVERLRAEFSGDGGEEIQVAVFAFLDELEREWLVKPQRFLDEYE